MPAVKNRLLLAYSHGDLVNGSPLLVFSNCLPIPAKFEPAGISYHEAALRVLGLDKKSDDDGSTSGKKEKGASPSVDSYHFKGKKKASTSGDQQDHYALLGLSHLRFLATEEQIRKSYREAALKHHPDKQAALLLGEETPEAKEAKKEEIDRHFKAIQEAYEVLIDPAKRRVYDSIDEFDDEVPADCSPDDFFKVFGSVFMRNGRWSVTQPVPSLGEDGTSIEDVDAFYDFWHSFKSWREFPHADEFDLDQAESREHKRWMERQNVKLREKAKKEENARIRLLVENAYKRDPRILRRKEEEKAEKLRKKEAKFLAKKEKEAEVARLLEEEKCRKVEEDRRAAEEAATQKKVREKEKKLLRKERSRLRAAAAGVIARKDLRVTDEDVESLCMSLEISQLRSLCEKMDGLEGIEHHAQLLRSALSGMDEPTPMETVSGSTALRALKAEPIADSHGAPDMGRSVNLKNQPGASLEKGMVNGHHVLSDVDQKKHTGTLNGGDKKERPWSKEEVELLRKAVTKYPKGTSQRWEVVANYIGTGRSVDEILKAIKTVLLQKPDSSKVFDSFLQKRKTSIVIDSPLSTREDGDTGTPEKSQSVLNGSVMVSTGPNRKEKLGVLENGGAIKDASYLEKKAQENSLSQSNGNIPTLANGGNTGSVEQDLWSETQEIALVKALKTFPKETLQRWERIAAAVPGKTKPQCFKRFAELRESFRSKKGAE